jgi:hypothetical protein
MSSSWLVSNQNYPLILKQELILNPLPLSSLCYSATSRTYEIINKQRRMPFYYFICCYFLYFRKKRTSLQIIYASSAKLAVNSTNHSVLLYAFFCTFFPCI